ncbi:MAG: cytochrome c3 family protein [Desulfuromonadaceae bacterium]|nr:cytochrome c3 family protein [Desulfuromonadaceae bacterium]
MRYSPVDRCKVSLVTILLVLGFVWPAYALLEAHLNYDGCATCHNLHSSAGGALQDISSNPEELCLSCHGPGGISTLTVMTHNLAGVDSAEVGYISCNDCHNSHNNGEETSLTNRDGTYNIKLVGLFKDYNSSPPVSLLSPQIREKRVATGLGALKEVVYNTAIDDYNRVPGINGVCNACHGETHNADQDCSACHGHDGGFAGAGDCRACHDGTGVGAEAISVSSPHSTNTIYNSVGVTFTCENCHTDHTSGTVLITNYNTVGISYGTGGISLGNSGGGIYNAVGLTEAEICWNCHDSYGVSEWGLNTDTNGAGSNYNTGTLSGATAPQWVSDDGLAVATWSSAQSLFSYKSGAIQSTHSVNSEVLSPGLDAVEDIRCSYCHDVHELNLATGDTTSGPPYLRGNWMGNPYLEDGAPQSGTVYGQYEWGPVPRGSVLNNEYGGYQIDQNNGGPTTGWTLASSAGLCTLCHGTDVDNMNQFGTASDDWVGSNGHSNAVIGGTGVNAANIFYTSDRAPSGVDTQGAKPDMGYANHGSGVGYGFRGTDGRSFQHAPGMDGSQASKATQPYGGSFYEWGASVDEATVDSQYHKFSCSKCHNPHASRLPRLMITNCLDTRHNTWDENADDGGPSIGNQNNNKITLSLTSSPDNWLRTWSNTTSAQNCHRVAGNNSAGWSPGYGDGWNDVTPW